MAITINGNGTVTGISVGGLPDGIVDTDMLAAGAVTSVKRGAGAVLQVIHGSTTTGVSQTTIDTKFDTNLSASITPSAASSKILIIVSQSTMVRSTASGSYYGALHLLRGSTVIINGLGDGNGNNIGGRNEQSPSAYNTTQNMTSLNYLDSPNTTSATTYKTQGELITSNSTMKCQESDTPSYITLMEIAA